MSNSPEKRESLLGIIDQQANRATQDQQAIIDLISDGGTTGSQLHDDLIRWRGVEAFDESIVEFYQSIQDKISGNAGELMALTYSYNRYDPNTGSCFSGPEKIEGFDFALYGRLGADSLVFDKEIGVCIKMDSHVIAFEYDPGKWMQPIRNDIKYLGSYEDAIRQQLGSGVVIESSLVPLSEVEKMTLSHKGGFYGPRQELRIGIDEVEKELTDLENLKVRSYFRGESDAWKSIRNFHLVTGIVAPEFVKNGMTYELTALQYSLEKGQDSNIQQQIEAEQQTIAKARERIKVLNQLQQDEQIRITNNTLTALRLNEFLES